MSTIVRSWRRDRGGATAATVALLMPSLLGAMGFGIDMGSIQVSRAELQSAADAAATAGARSLKTPSTVEATAIALAAANLPVAGNGNVLKGSDVIQGYWDGTARTFTPNSVAPANNAVQVTTRYATANGNVHRLNFGRFLGMETINLSATAIAVARTKCTVSTTMTLVSTFKPTQTKVVTMGQTCYTGSKWTSPCYYATPAGNPIIRIDSAYEGAAVVTYKVTSPSTYARTATFNAPYRGSFWYAMNDITVADKNNVTMVFANFSSNPYATPGGGTSTWVNKFNTTPTLPGTQICEAGTGGYTATLVN